jgi:ribulose 1,5-bisphosphate synthetase/thiazole synthase
MGMNEIVVQQEAIPILDAAGIRHDCRYEGLYVVDAAELACALCLQAIRAGAVLLNLVAVERLRARNLLAPQLASEIVVRLTTTPVTLPS